MSNPFLLNVSALIREPGEKKKVSVAGSISGMKTTESWVEDDAQVNLELDLVSVLGGLDAKGTATAPWLGECRRCLTEVGGTVGAKINEKFTVEEGEDTYPIENGEIDLEPLARDAILLALPLAPLCRQDCKGLCDQCGVNLNDEPDHEHVDLTDPRWDALDELKNDPSNN